MKDILLIDDEKELAEQYAETLQGEGFNVKVVATATEGLSLIKQNSKQVVISDINLPDVGLDGIELLKRVKAHFPETKVILITGFLKNAQYQAALDNGCDGFLAKPVMKKEFLNAISHAVKSGDGKSSVSIKEYARIPIEQFISGKQAGMSIFIKMKDGRFLKIAHSGNEIDLDRIHALMSRGVTELWIDKQDFEKYQKISQSFATLAKGKSDWSSTHKAKLISHAAHVAVEHLRLSGIAQGTIESAVGNLEEVVGSLADDTEGGALADTLLGTTSTFAGKSITVACIATLVTKVLGWTAKKNILKATMAGLLLDVGMLDLPEELQEKSPRKMNKAEFEEYKTHVIKGYEKVKSLPMVTPDVASVILQHHEDGTDRGFPHGISRSNIIPMTKLVQLIDRFVMDTNHYFQPGQPRPVPKLIQVIEEMNPAPLDDAAREALILLLQSKTIEQAADLYKKRFGGTRGNL